MIPMHMGSRCFKGIGAVSGLDGEDGLGGVSRVERFGAGGNYSTCIEQPFVFVVRPLVQNNR
jgi:hypothetical protein